MPKYGKLHRQRWQQYLKMKVKREPEQSVFGVFITGMAGYKTIHPGYHFMNRGRFFLFFGKVTQIEGEEGGYLRQS